MNKILHQIEDDLVIYRYQNLHQFVSFIEKKKTYLTNVSKWDDPYEDILKSLSVDGAKERYGEFRSIKSYYAQSWSENGNSDALWRIYSPDGKGLLIKSTVKKFNEIDGIKNSLVGRVNYYDEISSSLSKIMGKGVNDFLSTTLKPLFIKREAFKHEEEVRLVTAYHPDFMDTQRVEEEDYIELNLNPEEFIDEIILDPRSPDWYTETIEFFLKNKYMNIPVSKSKLYDFDERTLGKLKVHFK